MNGKISRPSGTWAMPWRATQSGSRPLMGRPAKATLPFCGSSAPHTERSTVVLPAPLAPRMVTICPSLTSKLTPRMAVIGPS